MKKCWYLLLITTAILMNGLNAQTKTGLHLTNRFIIGGSGGWDYLAISPINNWLYVSHGTRVNILNKISGDSAGVIENTVGVHGIAFDTEHNEGFTSNGKLNNVTIFDLKTNSVIGQIETGKNPDAIFLEPFTKKIITCNGRSNNLSIIDPVKNIVIDSIALTGKPETAVSDDKGRMYVNIEDKNEIAVIDTKTWKVLANWSLAPGEGPTGLAIDKITHRLFSSCNGWLMVLDAATGNIIDKVVIGDGCDGVAFDPSTKNIYTSNGEGTLSVIHENTADKFSLVENITTMKGARTIALDPVTHNIYLPTAEFDSLAAGQKGRPDIKAGSFQVLKLEN